VDRRTGRRCHQAACSSSPMRGGLRSSGVESFRPAGEHWFRRQGAFRVQLRQRSDLTNVRSGPLCGLKSDISRGPRSARLGHRQIIRSPSSVSASNVGEAPKQWGELPVAIWLPVLRQVGQKALVERSARGLRRAVPPTKHGRDLHARRRGNRVKLRSNERASFAAAAPARWDRHSIRGAYNLRYATRRLA
jgi:hypothetical protein